MAQGTLEYSGINWSFPGEAYALLRRPSHDIAPLPTPQLSLFDKVTNRVLSSEDDTEVSYSQRKRLGDLSPVYELRGWQPPGNQPHSLETESAIAQDWPSDDLDSESYSTPASSPPSDNPGHRDIITKKKVTFTDEARDGTQDANNALPVKIRVHPRHIVPIQTPDGVLVSLETDASPHMQLQTPRPQVPTHLQSDDLPSARYLLPSVITPAPLAVLYSPSTPNIVIKQNTIEPTVLLSREQKKRRIIEILIRRGEDISALLSASYTSVINNYGGKISEEGIHVFVDSSNIIINFQQALRKSRDINPQEFIKNANLSFHSLALIMERCRPVAKRVLVGSSSHLNRRPNYMVEAEKCGYEVSNLARVEKVMINKDLRRPRGGTGSGYGTGSGSEGPTNVLKVTEQGVDELLHLKIMESLFDYEPSTLVLATGDAAEAEFSGGFLMMIERAMKTGWKVELVTWRRGMSFAYKSKDFLSKWKGRFSIVYLDEFAEDLLSIYAVGMLAD